MKVIFDNDGSTDDVVALIYLLTHPGVSVEGVSIAATGEAHGPAGANNMADLCHLLGRSKMPIAYGSENSCENSGKPFPDFLRTRMDALFVGKNVPKNPAPVITDSAVELIKNIVEKSNTKITIMATGPLTNIAEFIQQYPALHERIEKIVIMGGAVDVPGNIQALDRESDNVVAEWNLYADPKAAEIVFASKIPVTLVPLDATNQVPMTEDFYNSLNGSNHPAIQLIYNLLKVIVDTFGMKVFLEYFYLWDPLAVMIGVNAELAITEKMFIEMDVENAQTKKVVANVNGASQIDVAVRIPKAELILKRLHDELAMNLINAQAKIMRSNHFLSVPAAAQLTEEEKRPVLNMR